VPKGRPEPLPSAANTQPLHLMLDEADLWAPQRAQSDGYDLLQRVEGVNQRGRVSRLTG